jgi:hypothetical protein
MNENWLNTTYRKEFEMPKKSQKENILEYLKRGNKITPLEALYQFGSFRLSAVIFELRQEGYNIITDKKKVDGKTFAEIRVMDNLMDALHEYVTRFGKDSNVYAECVLLYAQINKNKKKTKEYRDMI